MTNLPEAFHAPIPIALALLSFCPPPRSANSRALLLISQLLAMYSRLLGGVASLTRPTRLAASSLASTSQLQRVPWSRVTRPVFACERRPFATSYTLRQENTSGKPSADPEAPASPPAAQTTQENALPSLEPRLQITFTCTVEGCGKRSTHEFTKRSYEKGIVIVQCPGCENRCVLPASQHCTHATRPHATGTRTVGSVTASLADRRLCSQAFDC